MTEPVLVAQAIAKRFASFQALNNVDFSLYPGEVRALLGVNGAGKSTFVKILCGLYRKDHGSINVAGEAVELGTPAASLRAGIASVQQHPELVEDLTGYENIYLGSEASGALYDRAALRERAIALAERHELDVALDRPVGELSAIEREMIAILRAISASEIKVLILDEPTSVLTQREKAVLFGLVDRFRKRGVGIIYITHRLDEVFEIADSFTIFRGGKVITTELVTKHSNSEAIAEMMLGAALGSIYPNKRAMPGVTALEVSGLTVPGVLENVSLTARRGEVLGIFGLLGSGLHELSKTIFGALRPSSGTILVGGKPVAFKCPRDALRAGIFLVPGDRRTEGLTPTRDVAFNMTLAKLSRVSFGGLLKLGAARRHARRMARQVDLQPPDTHRQAEALSGGNQQKVVIAKGLFAEADVYLFVEPTIGVDIGARARVYALIRELSHDAAVVVMSSDADEVHGLSDRMIGMFAGCVAVEAEVANLSREALLVAGLAGKNSLNQAA